jgi:integrase
MIRRKPGSRIFVLDIWVGKKRFRRSLRTEERGLAIERARDIAAELRKPRAPGLPLAAFADKYLEWACVSKPAYARTERYYIGVIKPWFNNAGLSTLEVITPHDIERFRAHILTRPIGHTAKTTSRATANRYCALLRTMFNKARDWGDFKGDNPVSRVKFYREGSKVRPLTEAEIRAVLEATDTLAARKYATPLQREAPALFRLILQTGLRRSEALCLRWADVGDEAITIRGKGGKTRTVPLNSEARTILAKRGGASGYVFNIPGRSSGSILKRLHAIISEKASVHFHVHLLRHVFASRLLAAGVDVVTISQLLGHSAYMTTLLYAHSNPRLMKRAVALIGHRTVDAAGENVGSD